jgi:ATP-binding cassette subfamily B (MDR/TAP) protein 1
MLSMSIKENMLFAK